MATDIQLTPTEGMPPVETETSGTQQSAGTEQIVPSAAAVAAQGGTQTAADEVTQAAANINPGTAIEGKAQAADMAATEATREAEERQKLIDAKQPFIDEAKRLRDAAEERYFNHKFYDYWDTRSGSGKTEGDRIISNLMIGLNAWANAGLGMAGNEASDRLQKRIDRNFEQQKIDLHSKEQMAEWRRQGVKDVYDELQKELAALDMKQAKAHEAVAAKAEALALRAGIPEAQAKQWKEVTENNLKAAQLKQASAERYEKHAQSRFEKSQSNSLTSAKGAKQAPVFDAAGKTMGNTDAESARKVNTELGVMRQAADTLGNLIDSYKSGNVLNDPAKAQEVARDRIAMQEEIKSLMPQVKGFTRLTAEDMKVFDAILGGKFDAIMGSETSRKLAENALKRLEDTATKTVKAHGVQPDANILKANQQSTGPSDTDLVQWLNQNPNHPKAPLVRAKLKARGAL